MDFIKNTLELFKPDDFKNDIYGWLTNQLAHVIGSFFIVVFVFSLVLFFTEPIVFSISIGVSIFWVLWELRHLYISKNVKDFLEDMFFELSGVGMFYLVFNYLPKEHYSKLLAFSYLIIIVTSVLYYNRSKKN